MTKKRSSRGMGRPTVFVNSVPFEIKHLSADLAERIRRQRGTRSNRSYLEHLLRTHPEMQSNSNSNSNSNENENENENESK